MSLKRLRSCLLPSAFGLSLLAACGGPGPDDVTAAVNDYCMGCHNPVDFAGDLSFDQVDPAHVETDPAAWEAVVKKLRTRQMPPQDESRRPDEETYDELVAVLEEALDETAELNPGRPVLRRLNRAEYANAIRDLLGLTIDVSDLLPPDNSAFGFDNIGDLLDVSPALLERYLSAADRISALAVGDLSTPVGAKTYIVPGDQSQALHIEGLPLGTVGGLAVTHNFPVDAEYEFSLEL